MLGGQRRLQRRDAHVQNAPKKNRRLLRSVVGAFPRARPGASHAHTRAPCCADVYTQLYFTTKCDSEKQNRNRT